MKLGVKGGSCSSSVGEEGSKIISKVQIYRRGSNKVCLTSVSTLSFTFIVLGLLVLLFNFLKRKKCHNFYYFCLPFCIHWKYSYCTQLLVVKLTSLKNSIYLHFVRKKQVHNNGWGWKHVTALFLPCKYAQKLQQWEWKIFSSYLEVWNQNILIEKRSAY